MIIFKRYKYKFLNNKGKYRFNKFSTILKDIGSRVSNNRYSSVSFLYCSRLQSGPYSRFSFSYRKYGYL